MEKTKVLLVNASHLATDLVGQLNTATTEVTQAEQEDLLRLIQRPDHEKRSSTLLSFDTFDVGIFVLKDSASQDVSDEIKKAVEGLFPLPIIVLGSGEELQETAIAAGADEYLSQERLTLPLLQHFICSAKARALKESTEYNTAQQLRRIVQQYSSGLLVLDKLGVIKFANKAAEKLLGQSSENLTGQNFGLPSTEGDLLVLDIVREWSNDAEMVTIEMQTVEVDWCGERSYLGSLRDITDRSRQVRESREAVRMRDQFLATLSHELRNPLAAMSCAANLLVLEETDPELVREAATIVEQQCQVSTRLLDDLLDISRIWRSQIQLKSEFLDLNSILQDVISSIQHKLHAHQRTINVTLPEKRVHCFGDPARLHQVFLNLVTNSIKYTKEFGTISLELKEIEDQAIITVEDDGEGIEPSMLQAIFEPFIQARQTIHRSDGGLGIGLALVRKIVELHQGHVDVSSQGEGQGSVFQVTLPSYSSEPQVNDQISQQKVECLNLVVIDDDASIRHMMSRLLEVCGHQVSAASDGYTGIDLITEKLPDVALIDIGMPECSGYDVARKIRAKPETANVKLVAVTGFGQPQDRYRVLQAGFDEHLIKPVDLSRLNETLIKLSVKKSAPAPSKDSNHKTSERDIQLK